MSAVPAAKHISPQWAIFQATMNVRPALRQESLAQADKTFAGKSNKYNFAVFITDII